ncbi:MAG: DUF177 domain-containing protein [Gemmatimonadota bacterium]|nr:DUF177 domain-containing protein [Gemmatimonadota bacterium]
MSPTDPALGDLEVVPTRPVLVSGRLMASGPGSFYWAGRVRTQVHVTCRRCLVPFTLDVDDTVSLLFTEDEDNDDPAAVIVPPRTADIDLGDAVREALILAIPEFPLCRDDCRGLCAGCGADLNQGACGCRPETDLRWGPLHVLQNDEESR